MDTTIYIYIYHHQNNGYKQIYIYTYLIKAREFAKNWMDRSPWYSSIWGEWISVYVEYQLGVSSLWYQTSDPANLRKGGRRAVW